MDGQLFPGHTVCFVSDRQVLSRDVMLRDNNLSMSFQVTDFP